MLLLLGWVRGDSEQKGFLSNKFLEPPASCPISLHTKARKCARAYILHGSVDQCQNVSIPSFLKYAYSSALIAAWPWFIDIRVLEEHAHPLPANAKKQRQQSKQPLHLPQNLEATPCNGPRIGVDSFHLHCYLNTPPPLASQA